EIDNLNFSMGKKKRLRCNHPKEKFDLCSSCIASHFPEESAAALFHCYNKESSSFRILGFTQDPTNMQYYVITTYAESGDLNKYMCDNLTTLTWMDRLFIIWDISLDLERIHKAGLIHRDIHSGNILHTREVQHLLREVPIHTGYWNYYVGTNKWETTFGSMPHDINLSTAICKGLRPQPVPNTLPFYLQLMQNCWDNDPLKRPTAKEIKDQVGKWCWQPSKRKIQQMTDADESHYLSHTLLDDEKKSPEASFTSRALPLVTNISSRENMLVIASYDDPGLLKEILS
ncbi:11668_t:CDS:2, partial [Dentiscutata erythropus]